MKHLFLCVIALAYPVLASAQLAVEVCRPKLSGQKAIVPLVLRNAGTKAIGSARAACFLLDERGKMVGQSTRWVIDTQAQAGADGERGLVPGATNTFNFVITGTKPFASTNLTAKVQFTRVVLGGGEVVDPKTAVQIQPAPK